MVNQMSYIDLKIKLIFNKKNKRLSLRRVLALSMMIVMMADVFFWHAHVLAAEKHSQTYVNTYIYEGDQVFCIKGIDSEYTNNTFLSLRDLGAYLKGKKLGYSLSIDANTVVIKPGEDMEIPEGDLNPYTPEQLDMTTTTVVPKRISVTVGDRKVRVNAIITSVNDAGLDAFMHITDIQLYLGIPITRQEDELIIDDSEASGAIVDLEALEQDGYFDGFGAVCVGSLESDKLYYGYNEQEPLAIASVSKLMTTLCILDAIADGKYSYDTQIVITKEAAKLSVSGDGTFEMIPDTVTTVGDMLKCMLIASSNEAALTLAIHNSGSESEFAKEMNTKAQALGLSSALFWNASGLPVYSASSFPAKRQNVCSAADLFKLATVLLSKYPEITDITSTTETYIPSFDKTVKTTNGLLHNYKEVKGLKTGSTNRAGACLVSAMEAGDTYIISVLLKAESSTEQVRTSAMLLEYGRDTYLKRMGLSEDTDALPTTERALIQRVIDYLVRNSSNG